MVERLVLGLPEQNWPGCHAVPLVSAMLLPFFCFIICRTAWDKSMLLMCSGVGGRQAC